MNFRTLTEQHDLGVGDELGEKVDYFLADPRYNVLSDQNDDYAKYDVFSLSNLKDMANVLGDMMKLGRHEHVSCSALQFVFWYIALVSGEIMSETVTGNIPARAGLKPRRARV